MPVAALDGAAVGDGATGGGGAAKGGGESCEAPEALGGHGLGTLGTCGSAPDPRTNTDNQ
jgi:hypothetical protein